MLTAASKVFSGIQPSANGLHVGNLVGAIRPWNELLVSCAASRCFGVMDLHAATSVKLASKFAPPSTTTFDTCMQLAACGVDPRTSMIFRQSRIPQHLHLFWWLAAHCPLSKLTNMSHLRRKLGISDAPASLEAFGAASLGLLAYPVLMTADILLHRASHVVVGADQRQHVEFAREIAKRANNLLKGRHFTLPQMICTAGGCTKVMALDDGRRKMSKSDSSSPNAVLFLLDDAEVVKRKITASITDSCNRVAYDEQRQPALANLLRLYAFWEGISVSAICAKYEGVTNYRFLKQDLVNVVNGGLEPIRQAYRSISADDAKKHDIEEALCANEKKLQQECSLFLRDIQTEAKC